MTPKAKEKAEELRERAEELLLPAKYKIDGSHLFELSCRTAIEQVKEIQKFGNSSGVREEMMFWNRVQIELKKMLYFNGIK